MRRAVKNKIFSFCFIILALCLVAYVLFGDRLFASKGTEEGYSLFYEQVEKGTVEKVTISENKIEYTKKGLDELFYTQNPESPLLKEFLLKNNVSVSVENVQQKIEQILKGQNASYISESKQNFNDLKSHQDERLSEISSIIAETSSSLLNKYQQLEDTHQKILSLQKENFDLHIQELDKNFGILNQELNNEIVLSHQNIEMFTQKFINEQQFLENKYNNLSQTLNELCMYINTSAIKKRYWYYKLMRWYPFPAQRKKYKQKYNEAKQVYKKIRKLKYDF